MSLLTSHAACYDLGESTENSYPLETTEEFCLITIRNFEKQIAGHLNLSPSALDKRDRALRDKKRILKKMPGRTGAIPVTSSDAAYVILASISNAKPGKVVEAVDALGTLVCKSDGPVPAGFETLHSALTTIIEQKVRIAVNQMIVEPYAQTADIDLQIYTGELKDLNYERHNLSYGLKVPDIDLAISAETHVQQVYLVRGMFFDLVTHLLKDGSLSRSGWSGDNSSTDRRGQELREEQKVRSLGQNRVPSED